MAEGQSNNNSLEFTPTWVVAVVCFVIVMLSLVAERGLHKLGKCLKRNNQDALFEALQKLKEELMLLGFISLLLTVTQNAIRKICMPSHLAAIMLPCKRKKAEGGNTEHYQLFLDQSLPARRHLLSSSAEAVSCSKGKVPLLSLEALHQLHIFIFVLAVVHVLFCATTMVLGGARIRQWKVWEDSIRHRAKPQGQRGTPAAHEHHHQLFLEKHSKGRCSNSSAFSWMVSFFKQFYGSITKSDYIALRQGFITTHCSSMPHFDFHKYMLRTLEIDFRKIVGISWYLWLFVVIFLLLNVEGWHTYFWLAFLPLFLLLIVGAKLEHIIAQLAQEASEKNSQHNRRVETAAPERVEPSDKHFWFHRPAIALHLIHFILFQNSFEIAFFFWIWSTYGFDSCIMEKLGYIVPRLIMGVIVQVLCSYSTLPLYALVSQMGSRFKKGMFDDYVQSSLDDWLSSLRARREGDSTTNSHLDRLSTAHLPDAAEQEMVPISSAQNTSAVTHSPSSSV
ncbi:MLO-like protein 13 [Linum perenne]